MQGHALKGNANLRCGSAGINRRRIEDARALHERSSEPSWPRVMRNMPQGMRRSVDRGSAGQPLSSEIRNPGRRPSRIKGKATREAAINREPPPGPAESPSLSMRGHPAHENAALKPRESPEVPVDTRPTGRSGKASGRKPDANAAGQSDIGVVPMMASNKAGPRPAAEMKEGRPMTKENPERPTATRTQSLGEAMSGLDRIRKAARGEKTLRLNNLWCRGTSTITPCPTTSAR